MFAPGVEAKCEWEVCTYAYITQGAPRQTGLSEREPLRYSDAICAARSNNIQAESHVKDESDKPEVCTTYCELP